MVGNYTERFRNGTIEGRFDPEGHAFRHGSPHGREHRRVSIGPMLIAAILNSTGPPLNACPIGCHEAAVRRMQLFAACRVLGSGSQ